MLRLLARVIANEAAERPWDLMATDSSLLPNPDSSLVELARLYQLIICKGSEHVEFDSELVERWPKLLANNAAACFTSQAFNTLG